MSAGLLIKAHRPPGSKASPGTRQGESLNTGHYHQPDQEVCCEHVILICYGIDRSGLGSNFVSVETVKEAT